MISLPSLAQSETIRLRPRWRGPVLVECNKVRAQIGRTPARYLAANQRFDPHSGHLARGCTGNIASAGLLANSYRVAIIQQQRSRWHGFDPARRAARRGGAVLDGGFQDVAADHVDDHQRNRQETVARRTAGPTISPQATRISHTPTGSRNTRMPRQTGTTFPRSFGIAMLVHDQDRVDQERRHSVRHFVAARISQRFSGARRRWERHRFPNANRLEGGDFAEAEIGAGQKIRRGARPSRPAIKGIVPAAPGSSGTADERTTPAISSEAPAATCAPAQRLRPALRRFPPASCPIRTAQSRRRTGLHSANIR